MALEHDCPLEVVDEPTARLLMALCSLAADIVAHRVDAVALLRMIHDAVHVHREVPAAEVAAFMAAADEETLDAVARYFRQCCEEIELERISVTPTGRTFVRPGAKPPGAGPKGGFTN